LRDDKELARARARSDDIDEESVNSGLRRRGAAIDGRNLDDFGFVPRGLPVPDHHHLRGQLLLAGAGRTGLDERHCSRLLVGRSGRWDVSVDGRRRFEEDRIIRSNQGYVE